MKILTEGQVRDIVALRENGMKNEEIAKKYECHVSAIQQWVVKLRKMGYEIKRLKAGRKKTIES